MGEFDNALVLTTPHETGQRVKDAQWLMKGNSVFPGLACFKDGTVDGDYGLMTAQAAARTKYWLGFPQTKCDPTFGQVLYSLLVGHSKLTAAMKKNRAFRLASVTSGQNALEYARTQEGYKEHVPPFDFSNGTKYGAWYGFNGVPWCAIFESYCFAHSGYQRFHYAAVENIYNDAISYRNNLRIVHTPQQGDVVLYSIGRERYAHTAFFDGWVDQEAGTFMDFGGNTGPSNISNGGEVLRQERHMGLVLAVVRVG